jgi:hypothetical protein
MILQNLTVLNEFALVMLSRWCGPGLPVNALLALMAAVAWARYRGIDRGDGHGF